MTTGRCYRQIVPYMAQFPAMRYAITSSGAAVADCAQDRIISAQNLPADVAAELVRAFEGLDGFPILFFNGEALYRPELLDDPQHFGMDAYVDNFKSHCTACEDMERRFLAAPYPVEKLDFTLSIPPSAPSTSRVCRMCAPGSSRARVRVWRSTPSAPIRGAGCRRCAAA